MAPAHPDSYAAQRDWGVPDAAPLARYRIRPVQRRMVTCTGNRLALRFPVHVTIRGRFWADPAAALRAFEAAFGPPGRGPLALALSGPASGPPGLAWLCPEAGGPGRAALAELHRLAESALRAGVGRRRGAGGPRRRRLQPARYPGLGRGGPSRRDDVSDRRRGSPRSRWRPTRRAGPRRAASASSGRPTRRGAAPRRHHTPI